MSDQYIMDGHKLLWHLDRVEDWFSGKHIAPIHIDVGLSKGCNIKCEYCYGVTQGNFYRKGADIYFPREALLRYMCDAGRAGVRSMALIGEGEPLLNPAVYEAIVIGARAGVDIALGTNGILFDTGSSGRRALQYLMWIRFNISAATHDAYRRVHRSNDFKEALSKISFCVREKRKRGLGVTIGLQMVLTPSNVDQVLPLARLGKKLGVDYLVVKQCGDTNTNTLGVYKRLGEYEGYSDI
ncbi:MAG: radical SAM protein, partial [Candidatus Omnitrophica bacterium]|nr:radical SAM protein [Candidatus Omnitrophota bacterium]